MVEKMKPEINKMAEKMAEEIVEEMFNEDDNSKLIVESESEQ